MVQEPFKVDISKHVSALILVEFFPQNSAYFFYNDEFPNGSVSLSHGHTKGILVMSELGGFWIIHSVPKYPPQPSEQYSYPATGQRYGQTMLCISIPPLSQSQAENIGMLCWSILVFNIYL